MPGESRSTVGTGHQRHYKYRRSPLPSDRSFSLFSQVSNLLLPQAKILRLQINPSITCNPKAPNLIKDHEQQWLQRYTKSSYMRSPLRGLILGSSSVYDATAQSFGILNMLTFLYCSPSKITTTTLGGGATMCSTHRRRPPPISSRPPSRKSVHTSRTPSPERERG